MEVYFPDRMKGSLTNVKTRQTEVDGRFTPFARTFQKTLSKTTSVEERFAALFSAGVLVTADVKDWPGWGREDFPYYHLFQKEVDLSFLKQRPFTPGQPIVHNLYLDTQGLRMEGVGLVLHPEQRQKMEQDPAYAKELLEKVRILAIQSGCGQKIGWDHIRAVVIQVDKYGQVQLVTRGSFGEEPPEVQRARAKREQDMREAVREDRKKKLAVWLKKRRREKKDLEAILQSRWLLKQANLQRDLQRARWENPRPLLDKS